MSTEATPAATPTPAPAAESTPAAAAQTTPAPAPAATASAAPTGATPSTETAPVEYALKFPEGFKADEAMVKDFTGIAKELGMKPEGAQRIADFYAKAEQARAEKARTDAQAQQAEWKKAIESDKEIGGAALTESKQAARKVLAKFDPTGEFVKVLDDTGFGDHPALVRAFVRIGKAMSEDSIAGTNSNGTQTAANSEEAFLRSMYPTMHRSA